MTAVLYAKRQCSDVFDEVFRCTDMGSVKDAIKYAIDNNQINVHTTYKMALLETGEVKIFSRNTL